MRGNDLLLAFPALLLAIMFAAVFGASTLDRDGRDRHRDDPELRATGSAAARCRCMRTEYVARGPRGRPLAVRDRPAATCCPTSRSLVIVQASVGFAIAVLAEAALSFLGFGTPPADTVVGPDAAGEPGAAVRPRRGWRSCPGIAIAVAVLGFNLLGDGLRDRSTRKLEDRR